MLGTARQAGGPDPPRVHLTLFLLRFFSKADSLQIAPSHVDVFILGNGCREHLDLGMFDLRARLLTGSKSVERIQ